MSVSQDWFQKCLQRGSYRVSDVGQGPSGVHRAIALYRVFVMDFYSGDIYPRRTNRSCYCVSLCFVEVLKLFTVLPNTVQISFIFCAFFHPALCQGQCVCKLAKTTHLVPMVPQCFCKISPSPLSTGPGSMAGVCRKHPNSLAPDQCDRGDSQTWK